MKKKMLILSALPTLLFALIFGNAIAAPAEPTAYVQIFKSEYEFGTIDGQTTKMLTLDESGVTYVAEISSDSATQIYEVIKPWGIMELITSTITTTGSDGAVGNFNSDEFKDLVICGPADGSVWFGNGDGTFGSPEPFIGCNGIDAGQLDGVNGDDIVIATDSGVKIFTHNPTNPAMFTFTQVISSSVAFKDVALGLLSFSGGNVDDGIDFFAVSTTANNEILAIGNGDGTFEIDRGQSLDGSGHTVETQDVDLDGDDDVVVVDTNSGTQLYLNNMGFMTDLIGTYNPNATAVAFGNLDNDGIDVIFTGTDGLIHIYTSANQHQTIPFTGNGSSVLALDLDQDNDDDLIIGLSGEKNIIFKGGYYRSTISTTEPISATAEYGEIGYGLIELDIAGNTPLRGEISWDATWLDGNTSQFALSGNSSWSMIMDTTGLAAGVYTDTLSILTTDPENEIIENIPITLTVTAANITVSTTAITVTASADDMPQQVSVLFENKGTHQVSLYPSDNASWLSTGGFFNLQPGETKTLLVTVWPNGLTEGVHTGAIKVVANNEYTPDTVINVSVDIPGEFKIYLPTILK